jgi:lysophospholipase L1-like esterase
MRSLLLLLIAFSTLAAGAAAISAVTGWMAFIGSSGPPAAPLTDYDDRVSLFRSLETRADIVMVGDSQIARGEWSELLPGVRVVNRGIGRDTTDKLLERLDTVTSTGAQKAILLIGINDIIRGDAIDAVASRYKRIAGNLKSAGMDVVAISVLPVRGKHAAHSRRIADLNHAIAIVCMSDACEYVDAHARMAADDLLSEELTTDGLHLNGAGYVQLAEIIHSAYQRVPAFGS